MLPISHSSRILSLFVVFVVLAVFGTFAAVLGLAAMADGFRIYGFTRRAIRDAVIFVAFAAVIGLWDYHGHRRQEGAKPRRIPDRSYRLTVGASFDAA